MNKLSIADGLATGVAVSFTPFVGFHTLIALAIAAFLHQNKTAAILGTLFGNPWTFPIIWCADWQAGYFFLHSMQNFPAENLGLIFKESFYAFITLDFKIFFRDIAPIYQVMLIGCIPFCIASWLIISRFGVKLLIKATKESKNDTWVGM